MKNDSQFVDAEETVNSGFNVDLPLAVDFRPLPLVLLTKGYRYLAILLIAGVFGFLVSRPAPQGLSVEGYRAIAIFSLCLTLWVTQLIPLAITSILAITLIPIFGVLETKEAYALFGNEAVFFILGVFILAAAMMKSGLSTRVALLFIEKFGSSPSKLAGGVMFTGAFLSLWMSEHAVAAMLFPIVLELVHSLGLEPLKSRYGKALFLAMAWGVIIGGVATFLGGARNPLAVGILKESTGVSIGFLEWIIAILPEVIALLLVALFILARFFKPEITSVERARENIKGKIERMGRLSAREAGIGAIMLLTILSWIFIGQNIGLANIALLSVVVLFVFKLVNWKDIEGYVNWGVILMYGGAIALGAALAQSGAAAWIADITIRPLASNVLVAVLIFAGVSIFLTEGISNAAVVAILMPVGLGLSKSIGIDPKIVTYSIAMPSGLAFLLPMGTPANALAYSSGFLKLKDVFIYGLLLNFLAFIFFGLLVLFYWPLIGFRVW